MVCVSGGKDSFTLLSLLLACAGGADRLPHRRDEPRPEARRASPIVLPAYFESIESIPIVTENTYKIVKDKIPGSCHEEIKGRGQA